MCIYTYMYVVLNARHHEVCPAETKIGIVQKNTHHAKEHPLVLEVYIAVTSSRSASLSEDPTSSDLQGAGSTGLHPFWF